MTESEKWCPLNFGRIKRVFISSVFLLLCSGLITGYFGVQSGEVNKNVQFLSKALKLVGKTLAQIKIPETNNKSQDRGLNVNINTTTSSSTTSITINDGAVSLKTTVVPTRTVVNIKKQCYQYKVSHLDGSTSSLCYGKADYDSLVDLGYKLTSAKTFYEFHLDSAADYRAEYDRTKSGIYLDAKASSEASADREKAKMGTITLQMQEIEKRGF